MRETARKSMLGLSVLLMLVWYLIPATVQAANKVQITGQPQNVTVDNGATASTTVTATGDGLKYQWYYTSNGKNGTFYKSGTTKATYSTVMNEDRTGRKVYCVVTDQYGNTAKSNTVILNMTGKENTVKITGQPEGAMVANGSTASATVKATGDGLKYQWYYTSNGKDGTFYKSSTTKATYSTVMNADRAGRKVYCVVTDLYGNTAKTNTVTLNMKVNLAITSQPVGVTVDNGATASATVKAVGNGLKYQWYYTSNGKDGTFYKSSTTKATYSTVMNADRAGRKVYCVVTDQFGNSVKSDTVTLNMNKPLGISSQPKDVMAAAGEQASFSVGVSGGKAPYSYQWQYTYNGLNRFANLHTGVIWADGVLTDTLTINVGGAEFSEGFQFRCVVTDAAGASVISNSAMVLEKKVATILRQPMNVYVKSGKKAETFVEATGDGLKYQWYFTQNASDSTFEKSTNTTATYSTVMDASKSGRKVYCVISDKYGNKVTTSTVILAIETGTYNEEFMQEVLRLVNIEREKAGVGPLVMDSKVQAAAKVRAKELETYYSHTRPNGTSCFTIIEEFDIDWWYLGENIAMGQNSPEWVMNAWMNSEGHRKNILNPDFNKIGVGHFQDEYGYNYWCQLFVADN